MTRHELKDQLDHDQFSESVGSALQYARANKQKVTQWLIIAGVVLILVAGAIWFLSYRRAQRQQDLQAAFAVVDAQVGPPNEYAKTFATQAEKDKAVMKALSDVAAKDSGSAEGDIAQYYLGTLKAQQGDMKGAESDFSSVASSGSSASPLAKIALAQIYLSTNRISQGQELLRALVNKPTSLVSKDQAQILLAQFDSGTNPQQAKEILRTLSASKPDPAVARADDQVSAQIAK